VYYGLHDTELNRKDYLVSERTEFGVIKKFRRDIWHKGQLMESSVVGKFEETLSRIAPYMRNTTSKMREIFGTPWEREFEDILTRRFGDDLNSMERAIKGYVQFALDAMYLQKAFEKERRYSPKRFVEAASAVYNNEEYMLSLYLPGILLSNYLWPHHYRQLLYFHTAFAPSVLAAPDKRFVDVGAGTGFYCCQML
jgi:hypothetical protein